MMNKREDNPDVNKTKDTEFKNVYAYKVIYVFEHPDRKGYLKIGDATLYSDKSPDELTPNSKDLNEAARKRIHEYANIMGSSSKPIYTELACKTVVGKDGSLSLKAFRDYDVHNVLINSKINKVKFKDSTSKEWFKIDLQTAIKAIKAVKNNKHNLTGGAKAGYTPIVFRPEQELAIEKACKWFKKESKMLWNAKMRFGKTLSALQVIKKCKFKKTIILTHRPVVNDGWYEDFNKIFYDTDYVYGSKSDRNLNTKEFLKSNDKLVYFASIQDLRGSTTVGGKFNKNKEIFKLVWDCVIVDEAHEGTKTSLGDETIKAIFKEEKHKTKLLSLSGTPFNILDEYSDDGIYTWDYIMEQECKSEWDKNHYGDSNPYAELPELKILTYDLGDVFRNSNYVASEEKAFNFHEFFRIWTGDASIDGGAMPPDAEPGRFMHEKDIKSFLSLMTKEDSNSKYPFSKEEYRNLFKHSLWIVPGVKAAKELHRLMLENPVFGSGNFDIINVAGNETEEASDPLESVRNAINEADKIDGYTITLSCGKLTTGVTVKEWTAVFMLAGSYSTSAANYLQTIFRVQSPCNKNGKVKECAYVFDFAPDRTLRMVAEAVSVSTKAGKTTGTDKSSLNKFLNYCPVIAIQGSRMKHYDTGKLLQQLKKAYAEKVVRHGFDDPRLYNDELLKLQDVDIEEFNRLKGIIGTSKAAPTTNEININDQGLTKEEYERKKKLEKKNKKELTPEEKAELEKLKQKRKARQDAISILRGISIRMPLLIYGANIPYEEDISLDRFVKEVDDASWNEFMPQGVTKEIFNNFKKYYDEDIFVAAGRRIRNVTLSADNLSPTERIKKIAGLFSHFKNPDKETVLTPWRVVNLHLALGFGGYNFWNEDFTDTIEEPRYVDLGDSTKDTMSNINAKILEINSKTGLYPLYVAYSIYRKRCSLCTEELTFKQKKELWDKTVKENIFVICKTPMAKMITHRTLLGYTYENLKDKSTVINTRYYEDLINKLKENPRKIVNSILRAKNWKLEGKKMKFDAVVGNPPYQESQQNNNKGDAIYNYFYDLAEHVSNVYCLISPARFLFNGGLTKKSWNKKMLNDPYISVKLYEPESAIIFPSTDIKGGLVIIYRNTLKKNKPIRNFIPDPTLRLIVSRIDCEEGDTLPSIMYGGRSDLKFNEKFLADYPDSIENRLSFIQIKYPNVKKLGKGEEFELKSSTFESLEYVFHDKLTNNAEDYWQIFGLYKGDRTYRWIEKKYMNSRYPDRNNLNKYKVFIPKANGSGAFGEVLSTPVIGGPNISATPTFISIGAFETEEEASSLLKYLKTKFLRTLLGVLKITQDNPPPKWAYIPLQNFTSNSDIDWTKSIPEIDLQLYKKYNLSDEEIAYIEEKVAPMI